MENEASRSIHQGGARSPSAPHSGAPRAPATASRARSPCFAEASQDKPSARQDRRGPSTGSGQATTRRPKQPVAAGLLPRGRRQGIAALQSHEQDASQSLRLAGRVVPKSQTKAERLRPTSLRMSLPGGLRATHHTMDDASRSLHQGRDLRARRIRALPRARHGEVGRDLRARRFRACRVRPAARTPPQRRDFSRSDGSTATAREKGWDYDYDYDYDAGGQSPIENRKSKIPEP